MYLVTKAQVKQIVGDINIAEEFFPALNNEVVKLIKRALERAKKGLIHSSAGGGFGVERLIRFLTGVEHISEVQLFERIPGRKVEV